MTTPIKTIGLALAVSAAGMFASSAVVVADSHKDEAKLQCYGVNSCKGLNDCKTEKNECKGQGSCKGLGFLNMTKADCDKAGGTVK